MKVKLESLLHNQDLEMIFDKAESTLEQSTKEILSPFQSYFDPTPLKEII